VCSHGLGSANRGDERFRQEVEAADGLYSDAFLA
jgi:hypothetical protein